MWYSKDMRNDSASRDSKKAFIKQAVTLFNSGLRYEEIAVAMRLSERTIRRYLKESEKEKNELS